MIERILNRTIAMLGVLIVLIAIGVSELWKLLRA